MSHANPHPGRGEPASDADRFGQRAIAFAFRLYKSLVSPILHAIAPSRCLYLPTCSEYAFTALSRFGIVRGSWLALRRFARCHPWGSGGLDPVPERASPSKRCPAQPPAPDSGQTGTNHLP